MVYAGMLADAIEGRAASEVLNGHHGNWAGAIGKIAAGSWRGKTRHQIQASGYVAHSLEASLWSLAQRRYILGATPQTSAPRASVIKIVILAPRARATRAPSRRPWPRRFVSRSHPDFGKPIPGYAFSPNSPLPDPTAACGVVEILVPVNLVKTENFCGRQETSSPGTALRTNQSK